MALALVAHGLGAQREPGEAGPAGKCVGSDTDLAEEEEEEEEMCIPVIGSEQ